MLFQSTLQLFHSKCMLFRTALLAFSMNERNPLQFYRRSDKPRVSIALNDCPSQFNNDILFTHVHRTHEVSHRQLCEPTGFRDSIRSIDICICFFSINFWKNSSGSFLACSWDSRKSVVSRAVL